MAEKEGRKVENLLILTDVSDERSTEPVQLVKDLASALGIENVIIGSSLAEFGLEGGGTRSDVTVVIWMYTPPTFVMEVAPLLPNLKWVHSWMTGVNMLKSFLEDPRYKNIVVTNSKSAYSRPLAEFVMYAALHFEKDGLRLQNNKKGRLWDSYVMGELHGKTMGFIGYGSIAKTTAHLAKTFGMEVLALRSHRPKKDDATHADKMFYADEETGKFEVLRKSDFVVCSLPETPETIKFFGSAEFAAMKPTAVFISIGRGSVVDEKVLVEMLKTKTIKGAAMDVFTTEPLPEESELWDLENVLISSHNADWTPTYHESSCRVLKVNLSKFMACGELVTVIDKKKCY